MTGERHEESWTVYGSVVYLARQPTSVIYLPAHVYADAGIHVQYTIARDLSSPHRLIGYRALSDVNHPIFTSREACTLIITIGNVTLLN